MLFLNIIYHYTERQREEKTSGIRNKCAYLTSRSDTLFANPNEFRRVWGILTRAAGVAGQAVTGFRAGGGERVRAVWRHGRDRRGHHAGGRGDGGTAAAAVVMRHVVMVFRTRPGQTVRVLVVGERVLVARRHDHHGSGQVRLRLVEVIAAAVPRMALQRVSLLLLVWKKFRLEI